MRSADAAVGVLARGLAKLDACPALVADNDLGAFCEQLRTCMADLAAGRFRREGLPTIGRTASRAVP
jgi:hypothetical protein